MKLLLKRSQAMSNLPEPLKKFQKPVFKLWAKVEFEGDEEEIIKRYHFADQLMIEGDQPDLVRNSRMLGVGAFILTFMIFSGAGWGIAALLGLAVSGSASWYYYDKKREDIFVKDLIHGRFFECKSIVDLARKEAWLGVVTSVFRQIMESAKNWDGTETLAVEVLNEQESKYAVLRGL